MEVVAAGMRPMERVVSALGTLRAMDRATLSIKTTGRLRALHVDVGSVVRTGDVLAELEPRDYELRVQQSAALLAQARARVGLPLEGTDDDVDLERLSFVREARALYDEAIRNLDRVRRLQTDRISSEAELERAQAEHDVTRSRYLDALQEARERQAVLAQRRAEHEIARQQLADAALRAPFDGVVQERLTNAGEFLSAGSRVLTLVRTDPLRLQADIPERHAYLVRVGQPVRMVLEGDSHRYAGILARVSPELDGRTRMLRVEAEFPNPGHLRSGAFARVDIVVEQASPALAVPEEALVTFAGTEKVFLALTNRVVEQRLETGRREAGWVEIRRGLKAGDPVIRRPAGLRAGDPVRTEREVAKKTS